MIGPFSQTLLFLKRKKGVLLVFTLIMDIICEKRAANFIRKYKIAYFCVKIVLWILTTNFTKITNDRALFSNFVTFVEGRS
jgi:hypothetical protein